MVALVVALVVSYFYFPSGQSLVVALFLFSVGAIPRGCPIFISRWGNPLWLPYFYFPSGQSLVVALFLFSVGAIPRGCPIFIFRWGNPLWLPFFYFSLGQSLVVALFFYFSLGQSLVVVLVVALVRHPYTSICPFISLGNKISRAERRRVFCNLKS